MCRASGKRSSCEVESRAGGSMPIRVEFYWTMYMTEVLDKVSDCFHTKGTLNANT
jgi:hypothetical protein